jgi:hypothetical protein
MVKAGCNTNASWFLNITPNGSRLGEVAEHKTSIVVQILKLT